MDDLLVPCSKCKRKLPDADFYRAVSKKSCNNPGRKSHCKECIKEQRNAYYRTEAGYKVKIEKAWKDKGINMTVEAFGELLEEQDGVCAICSADRNKNGTALCVDHCHNTGVIRGLLCHNCNITLGRFSDNADNLRKAATYLEKQRSI